MSNIEPNRPASFDNPRDFVGKLCELIELVNPPLHPIMFEQGRQDKIEMIKRELTDYLLAADGRKGVYYKKNK